MFYFFTFYFLQHSLHFNIFGMNLPPILEKNQFTNFIEIQGTKTLIDEFESL